MTLLESNDLLQFKYRNTWTRWRGTEYPKVNNKDLRLFTKFEYKYILNLILVFLLLTLNRSMSAGMPSFLKYNIKMD